MSVGKHLRLLLHGVISIAVVAAVTSPIVATAATSTTSTTLNATVNAAITVSTSGTINISVTPTAAGSMSSSSDTVSVTTNNATGYNLTLTTNDAANDMVNGANTIAADPGTAASSSSTLTANRWGFRVDGLGNLGSGPTSAESNVASSAYRWAGVPATGSSNVIRTTASNATNSVTTVWYGVKSDLSKPSGTYSKTVVYTAITN